MLSGADLNECGWFRRPAHGFCLTQLPAQFRGEIFARFRRFGSGEWREKIRNCVLRWCAELALHGLVQTLSNVTPVAKVFSGDPQQLERAAAECADVLGG